MNSGKVFEDNFKKSVNQEKIYYQRVKDSPASFGQDSNFVRFTLNNPYDCFMFYDRCFFPTELKTTKNNSLSIQRDKTEKGKMIKLCQIDGLTDASQYKYIYAGFIINFTDEDNKENDKVYWLNIKSFNRFLKENDKKSINKKDVVEYGAIEIDKTLKKVHYKYNIEKLLDDIIMREGV